MIQTSRGLTKQPQIMELDSAKRGIIANRDYDGAVMKRRRRRTEGSFTLVNEFSNSIPRNRLRHWRYLFLRASSDNICCCTFCCFGLGRPRGPESSRRGGAAVSDATKASWRSTCVCRPRSEIELEAKFFALECMSA